MIYIFLILVIVTTLAAVKSFHEYSVWLTLLAIATGSIAFFMPFFFVKWQPSADTLTGYIYQRNNSYGYASYSLRYSQNAGADEQPSFCVRSGSEQDKTLQEFVGKDAKVQVTVPSSGVRLVNNPWACRSFASFDKVIEEQEEK